MNFSMVPVLFYYNKIKLNRYIFCFAKFFKINYSDNLTKMKKYFAGSSNNQLMYSTLFLYLKHNYKFYNLY